MPSQPATPQGKVLIEKARALGVPIDDLLTADGEGVAWTALQDFKVSINGVFVEFRKGDPIREFYLINELHRLECPVGSLESEVWRRLTMAKAAMPEEKGGELFIFKPTFHGIGIDLKEAGRQIRRFWKKKS